MTNKHTEFSQGVCQDGAAILKDGQMMTIEEILAHLRYHLRLRVALENSMLGLEAMIEDGRCGDTFTATVLHLDNCNAILAELDNLENGL